MTEHETVLEIIRLKDRLKDQAPINLDLNKTALLVIDAQRYFGSSDYHLRNSTSWGPTMH
jgi:hypothetical protein